MKKLTYAFVKVDSNGEVIEGSVVVGRKPIRSSQSDDIAVDELLQDFGMAYAIPIITISDTGKTYALGKSRLYIQAKR